MRTTSLRVYYGPADDAVPCSPQPRAARETITVPLGEVAPLLADAVQSQRTWLRDFEDDDITISMDLYEVILAYQHYRRPSA